MNSETNKKLNIFIESALVPLMLAITALLAMAMFASLKWRMCWDLPVLVYPVFAADRFGLIPYRDLFDVNMLGTYFVHYLWGHFLGYTDQAARAADMAYLCFLMVSIVFMLRRLGWLVSWMAAVLFGISYIRLGIYMSFQREFLLLPFIALGTGCAMTFENRAVGIRAFLVGLCFGGVACVKPQAGLGLILVLVFLYLDSRNEPEAHGSKFRRMFAIVMSAGMGYALPISVMIGYLFWKGAMGNFLDMAMHYWPLYGSLTKAHHILMPGERLPYLWSQIKMMGHHEIWYVPAFFGLYAALSHSSFEASRRRYVYLIAALTVCYGLYPAIQGQFFDYHWFPFLLFLVILSSLNFARPHYDCSPFPRLIPIAVLLLTVYTQTDAADGFRGLFPGANRQNHDKQDRIADFLKQNLKPGDTVQPLDWVGGRALYGMLIAEAKVATPFIYDVNFYHHVSTPYIRQLRERFIQNLKDAAPRFIIQPNRLKGEIVSGPDASYDFPELQQIITQDYTAARRDRDFIIFERRAERRTSAAEELPPPFHEPPALPFSVPNTGPIPAQSH